MPQVCTCENCGHQTAQPSHYEKYRDSVRRAVDKFYNKNKDQDWFKKRKHQYYLNRKEKLAKLAAEKAAAASTSEQ